jgi:Sulfotransferase family
MMLSARHILIVNARSVHRPVFVIGAPHSGADLIGRALKAAAGFHVTIGQRSVLRVAYAFARRPSMYHGRTQAAAAVIRDAFAQGWQVTAHSCLDCTRECRAAGGLQTDSVGPCVEVRGLERYGDATPDLIYCAEALTAAFPDARIVQVIRDGRDVAASMLADPVVMSWFRPSLVNVDTEFPNPFFGVETEEDRQTWPRLSPVGKCALRWRWSVRLAAQLHHRLDAGQLKTIRYEHLVSQPGDAISDLSHFVGTAVPATLIPKSPDGGTRRSRPRDRRGPSAYERSLTSDQITEIEKIAGEELRRLGYVP